MYSLVWFLWTMIFFVIWLIIYGFNPRWRQRMIWASLLTMPFGLSEPLFVPEYWSPPSLFDMARKTGFDIESLIFCFTIGGLGVIVYNLFFPVQEMRMELSERYHRHHRYHLFTLILPIAFFSFLYIFTDWNPIYNASLSMFVGALAALWCRPDLMKKIWFGGAIFTFFYFVNVLLIVLFVPEYVKNVWNLSALTGILILGVPLEEIMFGFTFGMLWSSFYEHILWFKIKV